MEIDMRKFINNAILILLFSVSIINFSFAQNPFVYLTDTLLNFHHDNEDMFPVPKDKHFSLRFNLAAPVPIPMILIFNGINVKFRAIKELKNIPQIDLFGTYGTVLALNYIPMEGIKPSYSDTTVGLNFTKSVDKKTRLFLGMQQTSLNFHIKLSTDTSSGSISLEEFKTDISDIYVFTGIEYHTSPTKYIYAQTGLGLKYNKIISRISMWYNFWELGLNIYPESLIVFYPYIACHICF
jgi:hypothetical protein